MGTWRPKPFTIAAVLVALPLLGNLATGTVRITNPWGVALVWAFTAALAAAALVIEHRGPGIAPPPAGDDLDQFTADLARVVQTQWRREEEHRKVTDPVPMPIRWRAADEHLVDHPANVYRAPGGLTAARPRLGGALAGI